jgi:hypothetical protein
MTATPAPVPRIRWEGEADRLRGYIGETDPLRLTITGPVGDCDWWQLQAWIPGVAGSTTATSGGPDDLKAEAERWLEEFTVSLGAVFPDALVADLRSRADDLEATVPRDEGHERDMFLVGAGLRRAADLIEHGDQPAAKEAGQ